MSPNSNVNVPGALAVDAQNLEQLKLQAKRDPKSAIGAASKQFEAVFLNMVLKSMREATPQDGLMGGEQTKFYTSMLDQQMAQHLAARGTGLAAAMARQLSAGVGAGGADAALPGAAGAGMPMPVTTPVPLSQTPGSRDSALARALDALHLQAADMPEVPVAPSSAVAKARQAAFLASIKGLDGAGGAAAAAVPNAADAPAPVTPAKDGADTGTSLLSKTRDFVSRMWSHAVDAARSIGVQPQFMIGQAALETGWGKHEIRNADGTSTHNMFGVKAGRDWTGPVVEKTTTEYVNGVAQKTTAKFRAYASYAESFRDYARVLQGNPRYSVALGQAHDAAGFARGLQKAGYATDPAYADKLIRVINGPSLKQAMNDTPTAQAAARIDVNA